MAFKVKNSDIFKLPPPNSHMVHLGTIGDGLREFIVLLCKADEHRGKVYIEEVVLTTVDYTTDVFANCKFIEDDALANDLAAFAAMKGLTDHEKIMGQLVETGRSSWITGIGGTNYSPK